VRFLPVETVDMQWIYLLSPVKVLLEECLKDAVERRADANGMPQ
jgi:hypothetical protein